MAIKGFVYIMSNRSMPGIIKIGMSTKIPDERAKELSSETSCPTPFIVEYYALFDDMISAESIAHQKLNEYRHGKEFFQVDILKAIGTIESIDINHIRLFSKKENDEKINQFKFEEEIKAKNKSELDKLLYEFYDAKYKTENLISNYPPREGFSRNYSTNEIVNSYNKLFDIFQTLKRYNYDHSLQSQEKEALYRKVLKCREDKKRYENNPTAENTFDSVYWVIIVVLGLGARALWMYLFN